MKNRSNTFLYIGLIISLLLSATLFAWYLYAKQTVIPTVEKRLNALVAKRTNELTNLFSRKEQYLIKLSEDDDLIASFDATPNKNSSSIPIQSKLWNQKDFLNILLIKPDGSIIYSQHEKELVGINIKDKKYSDASLLHSFNRTIMSMTPDIAAFSFDVFLKKPSLYATIPIFNSDKKFVGVVAVQLDMTEIYAVTNNYFDLGKTGDVIIAKAVTDGAQIISPSRQNAESTFNIIEYQAGKAVTPTQFSVQGQQGSQVALNDRGKKIVAAWSYIAPVAWGITLTMDYKEAALPIRQARLWWLLSLMLLLTIILLILINNRARISDWITKKIYIQPINLGLSSALLSSILLLSGVVYYYYQLHTASIMKVQTLAKNKIEHIAQKLSNETENIMNRATAIAQDLAAERLVDADILIRMKRDLTENPLLQGITIAYAPYAYDKAKQLYAPSMAKKGTEIITRQIEEQYDYSKAAASDKSKQWYQAGISQTKQWLEPEKDPISGKLITQYVVPFYGPHDVQQKKPRGVVVAQITLDSIGSFAQKVSIGKTSYAFMLSKGGAFMYHPNKQLIENGNSISNYAQATVNKPMYTIGTTMMQLKENAHDKESFMDPSTNELTWIHYIHIPKSPWSLALVFLDQEISIPSDTIRHIAMWIISLLLIAALLIGILVCNIAIAPALREYRAIVTSSVILMAGIISLWGIIQRTVSSLNDDKGIIIANQTSMTAYIDIEERKAASKFETIQTIPTGILMNSLSFADVEHVTINSYIWQKYPLETKLQPAITITGAKDLTIEKVREEKTSIEQIIGWRVIATIPQRFYYNQYPFDHKQLSIPIAHPLEKENLLLIADFDGYQSFGASQYLGITREFSLSEFSIQDTFFSYKPIEQQTSISNNAQQIDTPEIHFNMLMNRNTLHAFIIYFIPLLVILFAIFATISFTNIADKITSVAIIPYTGPLFALVILHGNLRRSYNIGGILYIEYLFFLTYLTMLLAITFTIAISRKKPKTKNHLALIKHWLNYYFWPTQFALWYCATLFAFY